MRLFKKNRSLLGNVLLIRGLALRDKFASGSSARLRAGNGTRPKIKNASGYMHGDWTINNARKHAADGRDPGLASSFKR